MHQLDGIKVERNVRLAGLGRAGQRREIDVLLTGNLAGYPIRVAIECKNERLPIGVSKIDAFVGKLNDVGIPVQLGIFVSASGYTSGAIERATAAGIRPLVLTGLTQDGLSTVVADAFQSVVYLLLETGKIEVTNTVSAATNAHDMLVFRDDEGRACGAIPDLIWLAWLNDQPPSTIGTYRLDFAIPPHWRHVVDGKVVATPAVSVEVHVVGLVVKLRGRAEHHALVNAADQSVERFRTNVAFDAAGTSFPVTVLRTESALDSFLDNTGTTRLIVGRFRLPRIRCDAVYWPVSARVVEALAEALRDEGLDRSPEAMREAIQGLEGTDLSAVWEPIWDEHLAMIQRLLGTQSSDSGATRPMA
jgi:hypothetical protein